VLVVGVGNILHSDDGFGVAVAQRLAERDLPAGVVVAETGIGGIHLVHELMAGYHALVVVDTVDRGRPPGTVMVIEADVIDVAPLPVEERHDLLADMHLATPERALMVARAIGVLPGRTIIIGCQPGEIEKLGIGLTGPVAEAVELAVTEIERCLAELRRGPACRPTPPPAEPER
jgi:hydrogenase maturation protease